MGTEVLLSSPRSPFAAESGCRGHASLSPPRWDFLVQGLKRSLAPAGFDIVHPLSVAWHMPGSVPAFLGASPGSTGIIMIFDTVEQPGGVCNVMSLRTASYRGPSFESRYNEHVEEPSQQLPASKGASTLAVLIGNNKNLWDRFQDAYEKDKGLQANEDPLDTYTERCMQSAASSLGRPCQIFLAHEGTSMAINGPGAELQRMAALTGLTYYDEASGLSLHPKYGSWFALRAVLVFHGIEHTGTRPEPLANPMSSTTQAYLRMASRSARSPSSENLAEMGSPYAGSPRSPSASGSLSRNASGELSRRSSGSSTSAGEEPLTWRSMAARWQRWVAVRDAPCPGHPWRYCPSMLQYHYMGDRACILSTKRRSQQQR